MFFENEMNVASGGPSQHQPTITRNNHHHTDGRSKFPKSTSVPQQLTRTLLTSTNSARSGGHVPPPAKPVKPPNLLVSRSADSLPSPSNGPPSAVGPHARSWRSSTVSGAGSPFTSKYDPRSEPGSLPSSISSTSVPNGVAKTSSEEADNPFVGSDEEEYAANEDTPNITQPLSERIATLQSTIQKPVTSSTISLGTSQIPSKAISPTPKRSHPPPPPPASRRRKEVDTPSIPPRPNSQVVPSGPDQQQQQSHHYQRQPQANGELAPTLPQRPGQAGSDDQSQQGVNVGVGGSNIGSKRSKVVQEILDTERSYLNDLNVMMETLLLNRRILIEYFPSFELRGQVYCIPAQQTRCLPPQDIKTLFSNLDVLIDTSRELLQVLEAATADSREEWIGEAFLQMMRKIEEVYCEYCKHNEAAMARLGEFASPECPPTIQQFLKQCQLQLQGRTGAWDLASLVIKPVQRVLKYPLLIKQLLKETPPTHTDYPQLSRAAREIDLVADKINEVKRRKDIVERYVEGKGSSSVIHGISKKFTRGTEKLKQATGINSDVTVDPLYDAVMERLELQHRQILKLRDELSNWIKAVKDAVEVQETMSGSFEDVYAMDNTTPSHLLPTILEYRKACSRLSLGVWKSAETKVKSTILPHLEALLTRFRDPFLVAKKRDQKLLDFDRARTLRAKGEDVEKALQDSADAYVAINDQLVEEIPKFLVLVGKAVDAVVAMIAGVQAEVYNDLKENFEPLHGLFLTSDPTDGLSHEAIRRDYGAALDEGGVVELGVREISALWKWHARMWPYSSFEPPADWGPKRNSTGSSVGPLGAGHSPVRQGSQHGRPAGQFAPPRVSSISSPSWSSSSPARPSVVRTNSGSEVKVGTLINFDDMGSEDSSVSGGQTSLLSPFDDGNTVRRNSTEYFSSYSTVAGDLKDIDWSSNDVHDGGDYRQVEGRDVVAMYPFQAETDDELSFELGSTIRVERVGGRPGCVGDDWWYGRMGATNGRTGWFPASYVMET
ncbi:hypothetical protein HK102_000026 [Quaeritorhiza haematococci]|nr:hypothetical protein HK102_000026 [Quaeritorhiza haematococci]